MKQLAQMSAGLNSSSTAASSTAIPDFLTAVIFTSKIADARGGPNVSAENRAIWHLRCDESAKTHIVVGDTAQWLPKHSLIRTPTGDRRSLQEAPAANLPAHRKAPSQPTPRQHKDERSHKPKPRSRAPQKSSLRKLSFFTSRVYEGLSVLRTYTGASFDESWETSLLALEPSARR